MMEMSKIDQRNEKNGKLVKDNSKEIKELPISYRGHDIYQDTKQVWFKNEISGHEWSEPVWVNNILLHGKMVSLLTPKIKSIKKAKEWVDYYIFLEKFITERGK